MSQLTCEVRSSHLLLVLSEDKHLNSVSYFFVSAERPEAPPSGFKIHPVTAPPTLCCTVMSLPPQCLC